MTMPEKTMNEVYGDGSDHLVCNKCGMCKTCGDCGTIGRCRTGAPINWDEVTKQNLEALGDEAWRTNTPSV